MADWHKYFLNVPNVVVMISFIIYLLTRIQVLTEEYMTVLLYFNSYIIGNTPYEYYDRIFPENNFLRGICKRKNTLM